MDIRATTSTVAGIVDFHTVFKSRHCKVGAARLLVCPFAVFVFSDRHNLACRNLNGYICRSDKRTHLTSNSCRTVCHAAKHTVSSADCGYAVIFRCPRKSHRVDRHCLLVDNSLHLHRIFALIVNHDVFQSESNIIACRHIYRKHCLNTVVSSLQSTHTFACAIECGAVVDNLAESLVAAELNALQVCIDKHTILVVAIEFRSIDTVFREVHRPVYETHLSDSLVVRHISNNKQTACHSTLFAVARLVEHAKRLCIHCRRAAAVDIDSLVGTSIVKHSGKFLSVYTSRNCATAVDNHHHQFSVVCRIADTCARMARAGVATVAFRVEHLARF